MQQITGMNDSLISEEQQNSSFLQLRQTVTTLKGHSIKLPIECSPSVRVVKASRLSDEFPIETSWFKKVGLLFRWLVNL
jgi:hypothetical protein